MLSRRSVLAGLVAVVLASLLPIAPTTAAPKIEKVGNTVYFAAGISGNTHKLSLGARPGGGVIALFERDTGSGRATYLRFYDGKMKRIGGTRQLTRSNYSAGNPRLGTIVPFPSGSVNVFFHGWADQSLDLLWMRRFKADGSSIGGLINVGGESLDWDRAFAARLANDTMLTAWWGYGNTHGKVLTQGGKRVAYNAGSLVNGTLMQIAALPDGGAVAAFVGPDTRASASFQLLSNRAGRVGTPKSFPSDYYGGMTVASHPSGFVGVWKYIGDDDRPYMDGAIFDSTGKVLARLARQPLRSPDTYRDLHPAVAALPDGRVLVVADSVYKPVASGAKRSYQLLGYLFGTDGRRIAPRVTLYSKSAENELWDYIALPRDLVPLGDGTLMLGYDGGYDGGLESVRGIRIRVVD